MPMTFKKARLITLNDNALTDHNRAELSIDVERIEKSHRMANGRMRKYVIADKRKFSTSWKMIPSSAIYTVDGFWGANEIEAFYNTNKGEVTMTITYVDASVATYTVMISEFSKTLLKRGRYDLYDVSITLEEV